MAMGQVKQTRVQTSRIRSFVDGKVTKAKIAQKPAAIKPALAHIAIRYFMVPLPTSVILRLFRSRNLRVSTSALGVLNFLGSLLLLRIAAHCARIPPIIVQVFGRTQEKSSHEAPCRPFAVPVRSHILHLRQASPRQVRAARSRQGLLAENLGWLVDSRHRERGQILCQWPAHLLRYRSFEIQQLGGIRKRSEGGSRRLQQREVHAERRRLHPPSRRFGLGDRNRKRRNDDQSRQG